jgi:calcineurin-like phosphoesterase family protein
LIYATSDHHLFHKNIIKYANRPFNADDDNSVEQMHVLMWESHNKTVKDDDVVFFLGDLSIGLQSKKGKCILKNTLVH